MSLLEKFIGARVTSEQSEDQGVTLLMRAERCRGRECRDTYASRSFHDVGGFPIQPSTQVT